MGIARSTVAVTLDRLAAVALCWPLPASLSDRVLEAMLYAGPGNQRGMRRKAEPDWTHVHHELRRPGVTLMLLWEEYRQAAPDGYGYSRWCELYRGWEGRLSPTMRQSHPAGERMFVDYAGQTVELYDARTGEIRAAQIFVAVMGASSYTYAEASWTQALPDWIGSHVRALAFMGGAPAQLVPDNPKVGVTRANWYEPGLNRTYLDLATHYRIAILPARPRRPRDKAKVEVGVLVVERWILARLRNRRFFSLSELNQAIAELIADLNARPMRRLGISRRDLFVELDTTDTRQQRHQFGTEFVELPALVPTIACLAQNRGDRTAGDTCFACHVPGSRPGHRPVGGLKTKVKLQQPILRRLIARWTARDQEFGKPIHTGPGMGILRPTARLQFRSDFGKALGAFADFTANLVADATKIAEPDAIHGKQLLDGMHTHAIEYVTGLDAVAELGDRAAPVEAAGNGLDAVFGDGATIQRLESPPPVAQHLLGVVEALLGVAT